jgi:hypothetical protein
MDRIDARPVDAERTDNLKKAKLEQDFYNIIEGEKVGTSKGLSVINPATGKELAAVPDVDRPLLNRAISDAGNAFSGWDAIPFGSHRADSFHRFIGASEQLTDFFQKNLPSAVSVTPRGLRRISSTPISSSKFFTCRLNAGCATRSCGAALVKFDALPAASTADAGVPL